MTTFDESNDNKLRFTARAIIPRDRQLLVMHRKRDGHEFYSLPGGYVEAGETPEHTVVREVAEEASVSISIIKLVYQYESPKWGFQKLYLCQYRSGQPALDPESEEARDTASGKNIYDPTWIDIDQLNKVTFYPESIKPDLIKALKEGKFPAEIKTYRDVSPLHQNTDRIE